MAIHTLLGFGAGFVAPLAFGTVLDAAGGTQEPQAWAWAFALLACGAPAGTAGTAARPKRSSQLTVNRSLEQDRLRWTRSGELT